LGHGEFNGNFKMNETWIVGKRETQQSTVLTPIAFFLFFFFAKGNRWFGDEGVRRMEEVLKQHTSLKDLNVGSKKKQRIVLDRREEKAKVVLVLIIVVKPRHQYRTRGSSESCEACQQVSSLADLGHFWYQYVSFIFCNLFILTSSLYLLLLLK